MTHKADEIMKEFEALITSLDQWFSGAVANQRAHDLPASVLNLTKALSFKLLLTSASSFHLRVQSMSNRFPYKLFWFVWQRPAMPCLKRRSVARELLDTEDVDLEFNARQLKALCQSELEFAAVDGRINLPHGSVLYAIVWSMSTMLHADTQLVESINSTIRLLSTRCNRIDLELLSARVQVKKSTAFLGLISFMFFSSLFLSVLAFVCSSFIFHLALLVVGLCFRRKAGLEAMVSLRVLYVLELCQQPRKYCSGFPKMGKQMLTMTKFRRGGRI